MENQEAVDAAKLDCLCSLLRKRLFRLMPEDGHYSLGTSLEASRCNISRLEPDTEVLPGIGIILQAHAETKPQCGKKHHGETVAFIQNVRAKVFPAVSSPYFMLSLPLNHRLIRKLEAQGNLSSAAKNTYREYATAEANAGILDAFYRFAGLAERPDLAPCLGPLLIREIHYRFLIGPLGEDVLHHISHHQNSALRRVANSLSKGLAAWFFTKS